MNVGKSLEWIEVLYQQGVREFCLCPGGRNAPLVKALNLIKNIQIYFFYDERAAGFFALGCSKRSGRPTAVVTTSGTAVANLLPATVEAYYSGIPLVLVTADRPKHYRSSGAPQSIEQIGLFSHYVGKTVDIEVESTTGIEINGIENEIKNEIENSEAFQLAVDRPTHINLCFDEPLLSDWRQIEEKYKNGLEIFPELRDLKKEKPVENTLFDSDATSGSESTYYAENHNEAGTPPLASMDPLTALDIQNLRPLVMLGPGLLPDFVKTILAGWKLPIYAEAGSSLRESASLSHLLLRGGPQAFQKIEPFKKIDAVIRIGQIPTLRLWRDLEFNLKEWPVFNFSHLPFSGLSRLRNPPLPYSCLQKIVGHFGWRLGEVEALVKESWAHQEVLDKKFSDYPYSEEAWFRKLSEWIPEGSQVFLGNSLPIREWDIAATIVDRNLKIYCNRGANGIDGLISTALGLASQKQANFGIVGDLSCLYDMNAFQVLNQVKAPFHLVVINNGGGKIFSSMFGDKNFENRHNHSFCSLAEMFDLEYHLVDRELPTSMSPSSSLIEIVPNLKVEPLI